MSSFSRLPVVSSGLRVTLAAEVALVNLLEVGCGTGEVVVGCFELFVPRLQAPVFSSLRLLIAVNGVEVNLQSVDASLGGSISVCLCSLCSCRGLKVCVVAFQLADFHLQAGIAGGDGVLDVILGRSDVGDGGQVEVALLGEVDVGIFEGVNFTSELPFGLPECLAVLSECIGVQLELGVLPAVPVVGLGKLSDAQLCGV